MKKKEEDSAAWISKARGRSFNYNSYLLGIKDFKLALRAEIEKRYKENNLKKGLHLCFTEQNLLSIIDEIKPLEK